MSVFSASMTHRSFYWQISLLCFVLGLLLAAAWHTTVSISRAGVASNRPGFYYGDGNLVNKYEIEIKKYESEIKKQREHTSELENAIAERGGAAETLNKELQNMKNLLGITEVEGPGILVNVSDSKKLPINPTDQINQANLIHDYDINNIVNELKSAGAEAVAINNQRVAFSSAVRCVGPVVQVNGQRVAPPIVIRAIGDADTLFTALDMAEGVLDKIRRYDPAMVRLEKRASVRVPAFSGTMQFQYAAPVKSEESASTSRRERGR